MGNFLLEGKVEGIAQEGPVYVVALSNGQKLLLDGQTILNAVTKVSESRKKGGNLAGIATTVLKGRRLTLAIQ